MMAFALLGILFMLAIIDRSTRIGRIESAKLRSEYKIFELRDKLRRAAIDGEVNTDTWLFQYLDTTLTRLVLHLDSVNVWEAVAFLVTHRNNKEIDSAVQKLLETLTKKENQKLAELHAAYIGILSNLLVARHRALIRCTVLLSRVVSISASFINSTKAEVTNAFVSSPKTSTLTQHCHH